VSLVGTRSTASQIRLVGWGPGGTRPYRRKVSYERSANAAETCGETPPSKHVNKFLEEKLQHHAARRIPVQLGAVSFSPPVIFPEMSCYRRWRAKAQHELTNTEGRGRDDFHVVPNFKSRAVSEVQYFCPLFASTVSVRIPISYRFWTGFGFAEFVLGHFR
jgi:hypothetical protein